MTLDRQMVVAVIDDDAGMRASTRHLLSSYGYRTETFDSASAFLNVAATNEAVCLVVDIQLGEISGLELARHLTMEGYTYPVIFMTGFPNEAVKARANSLGCIAFLEKPFSKELLLMLLKKRSVKVGDKIIDSEKINWAFHRHLIKKSEIGPNIRFRLKADI